MKVRVDFSLCEGHGRCYALAPDVFEEDERGHCQLLVAQVPPELRDQARLGEANCPEGAISTEES
jgi:ferredoxin